MSIPIVTQRWAEKQECIDRQGHHELQPSDSPSPHPAAYSHVFGLNESVRNNIFYLNDHTVLYPAGTQLVQYNVEQKAQRFYAINEGDGITSMAMSPSGVFVAVAVRGGGLHGAPGPAAGATPGQGPGTGSTGGMSGGSGPGGVAGVGVISGGAGQPGGMPRGASALFGPGTARTASAAAGPVGGGAAATAVGPGGFAGSASILICDLQNSRKRKILSTGDVGVKEFIAMSFTHDSKHIFAQSGAPDWTLFIWGWEKTKLIGSIRTSNNSNAEIHKMSCNPFDVANTQICVTGNNLFRIYRHVEGTFKLITNQKPDKNLLCHAWVNETRLVAGTEDAKILIFESGDLVLEIAYLLSPSAMLSASPNSPAPHPSICDVTSFSGGLLAGTSMGVCLLFERTDDAMMYKKNKEYFLEDAQVGTIAFNPGEDIAVVTLQNSQIYAITLDSDSGKGDQIPCDRLAQSFHHGVVTGMDTCARKPLIATCGADRSVRIWNYVENAIEVVKFFDDEPNSRSSIPQPSTDLLRRHARDARHRGPPSPAAPRSALHDAPHVASSPGSESSYRGYRASFGTRAARCPFPEEGRRKERTKYHCASQ
ncbi:hypothetical protein BDK51DRAFT_37886 [Blyttiomyces helicus]|uniref:Uncharacterized protein n=1 Tax=Blyttiomyces helicus TaxID=388810 RepID=A0A4P9WJG1_9FUNG|nr:hypothetical protein BDK51DRAFT_37886 [Blyttiomyces helicus]|eukprot:RKO90756.1 hypothetical protein BDK51DRAFT_37886 [Blyttiomyces helicus]